MVKLKTILLGAALALPLAAFSAVHDGSAVASAAVPPAVEAGGTSVECCWVYWQGRWYCIAYC